MTEAEKEVREMLLTALKTQENMELWLSMKHTCLDNYSAAGFIIYLYKMNIIDNDQDGWVEIRRLVRGIYE